MSKQTIWDGLSRFGFSDKAKSAIMGNMWEECGFKSNNVEDRCRETDETYTAAVDDGRYSRNDFMYDHGDAYGYGLCQWTYFTRKAGLYDLAKGRGVSIADEPMQLDYMWKELQTGEFSGVLAVLRSDATLREMTEKFMVDFEKPADKSQAAKDYRVSLAEKIYNEFAAKAATAQETLTEGKYCTPFWPPRMICKGMFGDDVAVLQALLRAHGYTLSDSAGIFGDSTETATQKYQADNGLDADGICGPKTWAAITKL